MEESTLSGDRGCTWRREERTGGAPEEHNDESFGREARPVSSVADGRGGETEEHLCRRPDREDARRTRPKLTTQSCVRPISACTTKSSVLNRTKPNDPKVLPTTWMLGDGTVHRKTGSGGRGDRRRRSDRRHVGVRGGARIFVVAICLLLASTQTGWNSDSPESSRTSPFAAGQVTPVVQDNSTLPGQDATNATATNATATEPIEADEQLQCLVAPNNMDPEKHKDVYRVGVLAIRGFDAAFAEFNATFTDYLTATAGAKFEPPLRFELKPLNFELLFTDVADGVVDFIYVNPSAYSCIESEYGAHSLVSQISKRKVGGEVYDLTKFGGVIFARSDNDGVRTIEDIRGKSVACASISGLGSGQMQFRVLQQRGLSYINDPKQMVFTSNQGKVVNGVLYGEFDVGYVRTDQLERTKDRNTGELVDLDDFKVIEPREGLSIGGEPFPFESSTPLYPEWNVASLVDVPNDVAIAVQEAMLALADHAAVGAELSTCYDEQNCTSPGDDSPLGQSRAICEDICYASVMPTGPSARCDTTPDVALLAHQAKTNGKYTGFRSTLSYMELRNMQEETAFIRKDETTGVMQCIRSSRIYEAVVCPPGHFKKPEEEVDNGCAAAGLPCKEGYQCVCQPCVPGFDVDVTPLALATDDTDLDPGQKSPDEATTTTTTGSSHYVPARSACAKMDVCGSIQQTKSLRYRAVDNKKRENATMSVLARDGDTEYTIPAQLVSSNGTYVYEFSVESSLVGVVLLEVFVDKEQIPESPLRLEVAPRDCAEDTRDPLRHPNINGDCVCQANAVDMAGRCVSFAILLPAIMAPLAVLFVCGVYVYVERKRKQADSVWAVKTAELHFADPPEVIGRGTFGLVVLAEYRGTMVAVKRVIPPKVSSQVPQIDRRTGLLGKGDLDQSGSGQGPLDVVVVQQTATEDDGRRSQTLGEVNFDLPDVEQAAMASGGMDGMSSGVMYKTKNKRKSDKGGNGGKTAEDSGNYPVRRDSSWTASGASNRSGSGFWQKRMNPRDDYARLRADFMTEMRHLSKLRHPCITTVMGAVISRKEEPMLVMEYMDHGSLYDLLHNETMVIEGDIVLPILKDIAQGMRFLHAASPQVIHGDLKAANVLVDSKFRAKVADFGLSQKKQVGATGTPLWMAPELLREESENTAASDVYSFGIVLFEMYSRKDPYYGEDHGSVLRLVADPNINKRPGVPQSMPPSVASIMSDCLVPESGGRPTFEELDLRLKRFDVENVEPGQMQFSLQKSKDQRAQRSADLLFEVFPRHVAEALRDGRKVEADKRECVTIFFSDIVGFTTISSTIDPTKVSDMLDRLYLQFDALSKLHDVFKVETIGDAYLAVTNLVKDQPDHARRIAEFAVDAMNAANDTLIDQDDPSRGYVQIRAGFHSGPCVADVVGSRNPKYTLFGDTVNTASRMESNSMTNRIQCSERSAALLRKQHPEMPLLSRGKIHVKGKGEMRTYWVNEGRNVFAANASVTSSNASLDTGSVNGDEAQNDLGLVPELAAVLECSDDD